MVTIVEAPSCDKCPAAARWSIANFEAVPAEATMPHAGLVLAPDVLPVVRWFACGHHLSQVLRANPWSTSRVLVSELRVE